MSEHRDEDDTTPLEYFVSGLVVLLFGLLYFFINHGKDFIPGFGDGVLAFSAPAVMATAAPAPDAGNTLFADNVNKTEMPSVDYVDSPVVNEQQLTLKPAGDAESMAQAGAELAAIEKNKEPQPLQQQAQMEQVRADMEPVERADNERMAAEKALRAELAAERARADEAMRKLAEAQKLLAAEKARNTESANTAVAEQSDAAPVFATRPAATQQQMYKLPDGTEIPVADEGFEGAVKNAMAKPSADDMALMSEPMLFDEVSFESGSAQLSGSSQDQIRAVAALMNTYQDRKVLIRGHTDNKGGVNANSLLSLVRSDSMRKQLIALGIDKSRIKIEGVGQLEPLASNDTAEGRRQNRRIELTLTE